MGLCYSKQKVKNYIFPDCEVIQELKKNVVKTCDCMDGQLCMKCPYTNQQCLGCYLCDMDL
jgi:hypothetical protein